MRMGMGTIMDITPQIDLVMLTEPDMTKTRFEKPTTITTTNEKPKDAKKPKDGQKERGIESGQIELGDKHKLKPKEGGGRGNGKIDYHVILDKGLMGEWAGGERGIGKDRDRRRGARAYLGICSGDPCHSPSGFVDLVQYSRA